MEEKIIVNIFIPGLGEEMEFRIPIHFTVEQGISLVTALITNLNTGLYEANQEADLMLRGNVPGAGQLLNPNETFANLLANNTIASGALLVLM